MITRIRRFIAYKYEKLKLISLSELFFIDFKVLAGLIIILLLEIISFAPRPLIFNTPQLETEKVIIDSLITTLSILFGIVFSFVVLSFNIFNKHFGRYVFVEFFKRNSIKRPFTLLLGTIFILIYIKSVLKDTDYENNYSISLYWLAISLSIISFLTLFPSIISVLKNSQSRNNIRNIVQRLNKEVDIEELEVRYLDKKHDLYYKNPIILLTEIGIIAIKEYDYTTISLITKECIEHFKKCAEIQNENLRKEKLSIYIDFTTLFLDLINVAVKERNTGIAINISRARFDIEDFILNNLDKVKIGYSLGSYRSWNLQFDIERYFDRAIQFNEDEVCKDIIENYREYICKTIKILLPKGYNCKVKTTCMIEADPVTDNFSKLNFFIDKILYYKKYSLYSTVNTTFFTVSGVIIESEFESSGKDHLLTVLANNEFDGFEKYISRDEVLTLSNSEVPFKRISYSNENTNYLLSCFLRSVDILFYRDKLNNIVLNDLKAYLLGLCRTMNENGIDNTAKILLGISKYERLANLITQNSIEKRKEIYVKSKTYLDTIRNYCIEIGYKNSEVEEKLKSAITSFKYFDEFLKELKDIGYIFDDKIV